jgi:hypothetical protein
VTMVGGLPDDQSGDEVQEGFHFWPPVRTILELCGFSETESEGNEK